MRVIVQSEDLSGRIDTGLYSKPSIEDALDCFFFGSEIYYLSADGDSEDGNTMSRADALAFFNQDGEVVFYDSDGAKTRIVRDITKG